MKYMWKYIREYRKESVLAPLFKMLEAGFELFVPLVMARMIDVGIRNQDSVSVARMGGVLFLLAAVGLSCSLTAQYFAAKAAVGVSTALRSDLFRHINTLSYSEQDAIGSSTFITRMTSDINQVQNGLNLALRLLLRSPFIVFGAMVMAFTVNVPAALVFVVVIPLLSIVVFGVMAATMPLYQKVQKRLDQVTLATRENLSGVRVIRAFNRQESEMQNFEGSNSLLVSLQIFVGKISALTNPVTYVIINAATIAVVWVAGEQVFSGVITQGETVALVNYMSQILVELVKLANLIVSISRALACANRVQSIMEVTTGIPDPQEGAAAQPAAKPDESRAEVVFSHVDFAYRGAGADSLSDISFAARRGQTIGIIGGTGSGKSSLVNLISRFYDIRRGSVMVDGRDVRNIPLKELRGRIGVVPQKAVLFHGTLRDNLRWGKEDAADEELYRALEIAQAREFVDSRGQGLDLEIEQNGRNLSGGQRQRLTIARALVRQPKILILDDSASALDYATDARLRKAIRESTKDMTVFLVSQRVATVKNADWILVLDDGKMAGAGTHRELLKNCGVYREICLSQLSGEEVERDENIHAEK